MSDNTDHNLIGLLLKLIINQERELDKVTCRHRVERNNPVVRILHQNGSSATTPKVMDRSGKQQDKTTHRECKAFHSFKDRDGVLLAI